MESIRQLYKIGTGPSSSHTMAPRKAAEVFVRGAAGASRCRVTLYGALAATGRGHLTDRAILDVLVPVMPTEIVWKPETVLDFHTNGMRFEAFGDDGSVVSDRTFFSIGGGDIVEQGEESAPSRTIYSMNKIADILSWCEKT